jgi:hypothetical protein
LKNEITCGFTGDFVDKGSKKEERPPEKPAAHYEKNNRLCWLVLFDF